MDITTIFKKNKYVWVDELIRKFKEIGKQNDAIKEVLNYLCKNKKKFKTVDYYQDFSK